MGAKEIGGYLELEHFSGDFPFSDAHRYQLGRSAILHFLQEAGCTCVYLPTLYCHTVTDYLRKAGITCILYPIRADFSPAEGALPDTLPDRTWILLNDMYGLLPKETILSLKEQYDCVLLDETHAFFRADAPAVDRVVSLRKYFGLPDGALLWTNRTIRDPEEQDISADRMTHLLGRFEKDASSYYQDMLATADTFHAQPVKRMSALTENLCRAISYEDIRRRREENFRILHEHLGKSNALSCNDSMDGPFVYPFFFKGAGSMRAQLAKEKIYIPCYWKDIKDRAPDDDMAIQYAEDILALPIDQRYDREDMIYLAGIVRSLCDGGAT